jgi:DNA polymerase-3 subunit beta
VANIFLSGKSNEMKFKIDSETKKIIISSEGAETGNNSTELDFEIQGASQEIVFNLKYLLDGINIIPTSRVAILSNTETSPVAIQAVEEGNSGEIIKNYTYIVMPIKN